MKGREAAVWDRQCLLQELSEHLLKVWARNVPSSHGEHMDEQIPGGGW